MSRSAYGLSTPIQTDWRARGACQDEDPELFFPIGDGRPAERQIAAAKTVCRRCTVSTECGAEAMDRGLGGVWGGLTEEERRALKRRDGRQRARASTPVPVKPPAVDVATEITRLWASGNTVAWIAMHLRLPEDEVERHLAEQDGAAA